MTYLIQPGDLLVAPPAMADSFFQETVIWLCEHGTRGSSGFVMNNPTDRYLSDIFSHLDEEWIDDDILYQGGPVATNRLFMAHTSDWKNPSTKSVTPHLSVTTEFSERPNEADGDTPSDWRVFSGCAAWSPNQLMGELLGKSPWHHTQSWLVINQPDPMWVLGIDPSILWREALTIASQQTVKSWMV